MEKRPNGASNKKEKKVTPVALIVRFEINDADEPDKTKSFLVVVKFNPVPCITDVVKPMKDQNLKARKLADQATKKNCVEPENKTR